MKTPHRRIQTQDNRGIPNGHVVPILEQNGSTFAYITTIRAGMMKGPHLHKQRASHFTCISGNVRIVIKSGPLYLQYLIGEECGYATVAVPPGEGCLIHNIGLTEAKVLNRPNPPWRRDQYDEHVPTDFELNQPGLHGAPCFQCNGPTYIEMDQIIGFCGRCRTHSVMQTIPELRGSVQLSGR
jgi:hypothetical protein